MTEQESVVVADEHKRTIRSFVLRQGHMTASQQRAIDTLWSQFGVDYQTTGLDLNQCFGREQAKVLEIGFGMGVATAEIARRLPETDFLAIDVHGPGVGNLLKLGGTRPTGVTYSVTQNGRPILGGPQYFPN